MPQINWYDTARGQKRYLQELRIIEKKIIKPKILKKDGILWVQGHYLCEKKEYPLIIQFPPIYPEMVPRVWILQRDFPVILPDFSFAPHQYSDGSLCLFTGDWGPHGWHSEMTLDQVLDKLGASIKKTISGTHEIEHFSIQHPLPGYIQKEEIFIPTEIVGKILGFSGNTLDLDLFSFQDDRPTQILLLPAHEEVTKNLQTKFPWGTYELKSPPLKGLLIKLTFSIDEFRKKLGEILDLKYILPQWGYQDTILENKDFILWFFSDTTKHSENIRDPSKFDPLFSYLYKIKDASLTNIYKIPLYKVLEANIPNDCFQRTYGVLEDLVTSIRKKTIMLIGLGTLGSQIALELAKTGINHFIFYDFDTLQPSNICRHTGDLLELGQYKTVIVRKQIKSRNPNATVVSCNYNPFLIEHVVEFIEYLKKSDLVILTTANHQSALGLNRLALDHRIPVVYAWCGSNAKEGRVFRVIPFQTPCYYCINLLLEMEPNKYPRLEPLSAEENIPQFEGYREPGIPGISIEINFIGLFAARFALQTLFSGTEKYNDNHSDHYIWRNRGESSEYYEFPVLIPFSFRRIKSCPMCNTRVLTRVRDPKIQKQIQALETHFH